MQYLIYVLFATSIIIGTVSIKAAPKIPFLWPQKSCDEMAKVVAPLLWENIKTKWINNPKAKIGRLDRNHLRGTVAEYCAFCGIKEALADRPNVKISLGVQFRIGKSTLAEVDLLVHDLSRGFLDIYEIKNRTNVQSAQRKSALQFDNLKSKLYATKGYAWSSEQQVLLFAILFGDPSFHFMTYKVPDLQIHNSDINYVPLPFSREDLDDITHKVYEKISAWSQSHANSQLRSY